MMNLEMASTTNGEGSLIKRKKKKQQMQKTEPISNPSLPHDLLVSCIARVSMLHYPTLSLVSKSFRSLIVSPELYKIRSLLNCTNTCLYVCLQFPSDSSPRWFKLCQKPYKNQITKKKKKKKREPSGYYLASVSTINSPHEWSNLVSVGSNLYAISGPINDTPRSNVSFLDCRTHTWLEAPRLRFACTDSKFDGKMYLPGPSENIESLNCIEVFDTKTETWNPVPPEKRILKPQDMEGKLFAKWDEVCGLSIKIKDMTWEAVGADPFDRCSLCVVENVAYAYRFPGSFEWREMIAGNEVWRTVKGLERLPEFPYYSNVKLVNYDGKLMVLWDKYVWASGSTEKMIWCAEISLEKRSNEEIWGNVEWFDAVLAVPKSYRFVYDVTARF